MTGIGTLREHHLHATLKEHYRQPGDLVEQSVEGFIVDLVRGQELIEIQTRGFSAMRRKLDTLLDAHPVRLVHPIAAEKWIVRIGEGDEQLSRRRSPKRGITADVALELTSFPTLLSHPNFRLEVLLTREEEVRRPDAKAWRRRGWRLAERRLLDVLQRVELSRPEDLLTLLPDGLPQTFTTADLAARLERPRRVATALAYCLREAEVLKQLARTRQGIQYRLPRQPAR